MSDSVTRAALERTLPPVAPGSRAEALVAELYADWMREAGDDRHSDEILEQLLADWTDRVRGLDAAAVTAELERVVVERRVAGLGRESWRLGLAALGLDPGLAPRDAAPLAEALTEQVGGLAASIRSLGPVPEVDLLHRDLREAAVELVYAVQGGAMSPRLARAAEDARGSGRP